VNTKFVLGFALVLATPCVAQAPPNDPGAMSCADYVKAAKSSPTGQLGSVPTGDAEADAMMKEVGQKILKVCAAKPKITVRDAIQQSLMED